MPAGQQQTEFVQGAGGCRERGGGRQGQRARAGRHQHGQDDPERPRWVQLPPQQANAGRGDQREQQEPLGGAVGDLGQAWLFRLGPLQQADNSRQARILAQGQDLNGQCSFDIECAGGNGIAGAARLGQVFAGQQ
ncbi:hypothetical protein D3C76_1459660 [compost metagenome]